MNRTVLRLTLLAAIATTAGNALAVVTPSASSNAPPGNGWQLLNSTPTASSAPMEAPVAPASVVPRTLDAPTPSAPTPLASVPAPVKEANTAVASVEVPASAAVAASPVAKMWSVSTSDTNFRQLLDHWTQQEGWKLVWGYGQDVPIVGDDTFTGDFRFAARRALASTELTDTPIKPCFYSNHTMRVVSFTTQCDPTRTAAAAQ